MCLAFLTFDFVVPRRQTVYRSGTAGDFGSASRVFNTSQLAVSACPANAEGVRHFVITLEDHGNSSVSPIVWGAVVGCEGRGGCEQFTARELIEFPIYIWRNHSSYWTGFPWWITLFNFFFASVAVAIVRHLLRRCFATECWVDCATGSFCSCWTRCCGRLCCCFFTEKWSIDQAGEWRVFDASEPAIKDKENVHKRAPLYELAVLGWAWAMLDTTVHYSVCLAADDLSDDLAFSHLAFWGGVIFWGNMLPLTITLLCWWGTRRRFGPDERFGVTMYSWWTRPDVWAPLEIATGVSWLFNFGGGYFIGPTATILAGLIRLNEISSVNALFRSWSRGGRRVDHRMIGQIVVKPAAGPMGKEKGGEEMDFMLPGMFLNDSLRLPY